jgi:putative transport protein
MQVGPGFFTSMRHQGTPLNLIALGIVLLGAGLAVAFHLWGGVPLAAAVGILSGATTNTPSLGAAQQALQTLPDTTEAIGKLPGLGYAVAYPFGILGIILAMLFFRLIFRIKISQEEENFRLQQFPDRPKIAAVNLHVTNPNLANIRIADLPGFATSGVVISRLEQNGVTQVAHDDMPLQPGNTLTAVGPQLELDKLRLIIGHESALDLRVMTGAVAVQRFVLTNKNLIGTSLEDLALEHKHNVRFTRISRSEVDLPNPTRIRLQAGDVLTVVGEEPALRSVGQFVGNSVKDLNDAHVLPVFIGIALGIVAGSFPLYVPGIPAPIRLGLAGGPLLAAILLSHIGRVGRIVWHMPQNANMLLREIGIVLFLACVGLKSGGQFIDTLVHGAGFYWMFCGSVITLLPLLIMGTIARLFLKMNYLTICGVLAGSMTDPPALAFANSTTRIEAPAVSYATVYPLTMLARVICAQLIILLLD